MAMQTHVLIVDDEPAILEIVGDFFRARGFSVAVANSSAQARIALEKQSYAVVLADLHLGSYINLDGLDVARYARERSPMGQIFLMSGCFPTEIRVIAENLGLSGLLQKPFRLSEVSSVMRSDHFAA